MKKIITLLFSVCFLTAAFAQDGRHDHYGQPNQNNYQSSNYSRDNNRYNQSYQWNNRQEENRYGHYDDREYKNRDDREYRDRDYRRGTIENHSYSNYRRVPGFEIIFGSRDRH